MTTGPSTAPVRRPKIRYVERFKPWDELPTPLPLFAGEVETRSVEGEGRATAPPSPSTLRASTSPEWQHTLTVSPRQPPEPPCSAAPSGQKRLARPPPPVQRWPCRSPRRRRLGSPPPRSSASAPGTRSFRLGS